MSDAISDAIKDRQHSVDLSSLPPFPPPVADISRATYHTVSPKFAISPYPPICLQLGLVQYMLHVKQCYVHSSRTLAYVFLPCV